MKELINRKVQLTYLKIIEKKLHCYFGHIPKLLKEKHVGGLFSRSKNELKYFLEEHSHFSSTAFPEKTFGI